MNLWTEKEIGIENGFGMGKSNKKSSQLPTKNVAFLSLRREMVIFAPDHFSSLIFLIRAKNF
jgi:hypothetical protein